MSVFSAALGQTIFWCAVQLACVSLVTIVVARLVCRRNPAASVWCLRAGLVSAIVVTGVAAAPLPSWFAARTATGTANTTKLQTSGDVATSTAALDEGPELLPTRSTDAEGELTAAESLWNNFGQLIREASTMPAPPLEPTEVAAAPEPQANPTSPTPIVLLAVCATLGIGWFILGLISVRRLMATGEIVTDARVAEMLDVVLAQASCTKKVRLIETEHIASPATVGFFRPIILLPATWYDWTDEELHVVLAHEVAHVRANDFASTVVSQLLVAVHFFNPFMHVLSRQLRMAQELAADASASVMSGGKTEYATVLAGMALRTDSQSNLWATQAFLPAPRTMLRRIEMLRDSKNLRTSVSRSARVALAVLVTTTTCVATGLRANLVTKDAESAVSAEATPSPAEPTPKGWRVQPRQSRELSLDWVPNGSIAVFAVKPAEVAKHAAFKPLSAEIARLTRTSTKGLDLDEIDSVTFGQAHPEVSQSRSYTKPRMAFGDFMVIRSRVKSDWSDLKKFHGEVQTRTVNGLTVHGTQTGIAYFMPDEFTFVLGQTKVVLEIAEFGKKGTTNRFWHEQWDRVKDKPVATLVDLGALREVVPVRRGVSGMAGGGLGGAGAGMADDDFGGGYPGSGGAGMSGGGYPGSGGAGMAGGGYPGGGGSQRARSSQAEPISNLLGMNVSGEFNKIREVGELMTAFVDPAESVKVNILITTLSQSAGASVKKALVSATAIASVIIKRQERTIARSRRREVALLSDLINIADQAIGDLRLKQSNNNVELELEFPTDQLAKAVNQLAPAVAKMQKAASKSSIESQQKNNAKQIALALHNYHDVYGSFPPAYSLGKDGNGKHPVSWRVLLTPFLERPEILKNYKFDEPWNSQHNKQVTADMPEVFLPPSLPRGSTNAGYYAVISTDAKQPTAFGRHRGHKLAEFRDGTSNSIFFVEAMTGWHWAQPKDIEWDPATPFPKIGGLTEKPFLAARADGSVAQFDANRTPDVLKLMLTISDGQIVSAPEAQPRR